MGTLSLAAYIHHQLLELTDAQDSIGEDKNPSLKWTGSKADLVELVYALMASKVVDYGTVSVVELVSIISEAFGVELQGYYSTFLEIKSRKKNRTVFLDRCKESLEAYMHSFDSKG